MPDPSHPFKRPESVLVVVYTTAGDVLLLRRRRPDFWQSVTGSLKWPAETPMQAAHRELAEETGIADVGRIRDCTMSNRFEVLPEYRHRYAPGVSENLEHVFSLELPERAQVTICHEHSEYAWMPFDQAIDTVWSWSNRAALERVREQR